MLPNITNKRCVIFGIQGSGKSELAKILTLSVPAHIVYDVHHEYNGLNRYLVEHKRVNPRDKNDQAIAELNNFVQRCIFDTKAVRLFTLDEANRYCPNHYPLPDTIQVLNDDNRHDKIAFISIARRPAQLNTDLTELAHYMFIFTLEGRNDLQFLEDTAVGLGTAVAKLKPFHFIIKEKGKPYQIHKPIQMV